MAETNGIGKQVVGSLTGALTGGLATGLGNLAGSLLDGIGKTDESENWVSQDWPWYFDVDKFTSNPNPMYNFPKFLNSNLNFFRDQPWDTFLGSNIRMTPTEKYDHVLNIYEDFGDASLLATLEAVIAGKNPDLSGLNQPKKNTGVSFDFGNDGEAYGYPQTNVSWWDNLGAVNRKIIMGLLAILAGVGIYKAVKKK